MTNKALLEQNLPLEHGFGDILTVDSRRCVEEKMYVICDAFGNLLHNLRRELTLVVNHPIIQRLFSRTQLSHKLHAQSHALILLVELITYAFHRPPNSNSGAWPILLNSLAELTEWCDTRKRSQRHHTLLSQHRLPRFRGHHPIHRVEHIFPFHEAFGRTSTHLEPSTIRNLDK